MKSSPVKWFKQKDPSDHLNAVVVNLFRLLRVPATITKIRETIKSHPDFPSLLSIAESIRDWGLRTEAVKGAVTDLSKDDCPGIAHLKSNTFVVVEDINIKDGQIRFLDPIKGRISCPLESFAEIWSGVILHVYPEKNAGEKDFRINKIKEVLKTFRATLPFSILGLISILAFVYGLEKVGNVITFISLGIVKLAGLAFCIIMALSGITDARLLSHVCPIGKKVNCLRVLNSPAGKIFGVSMAELGVLYFSGGLLTLIFMPFMGNVGLNIFLLAILNILTLPYTFFSLIYQAFVIHSWCWICVVVQVLFWVEFYILFDSLSMGFFGFVWTLPLPFIIGFSFPTSSWMWWRSITIWSHRADKFEHELLRYRRNPLFVRMQLAGGEKVDMGNFSGDLEVGPNDARITLTLVVNPLCSFCSNAMRQLDHLIKLGQGQIKGNIRFLVWKGDKDKSNIEKLMDYEVAVRIVSMVQSGKQKAARDALVGWFLTGHEFTKKKFKKWLKKFSVKKNIENEKAERCLYKCARWAKSASISATPAIFFNDIKLPSKIQLEDLKFFLLRQIEE